MCLAAMPAPHAMIRCLFSRYTYIMFFLFPEPPYPPGTTMNSPPLLHPVAETLVWLDIGLEKDGWEAVF
jgi:hypothetical protein